MANEKAKTVKPVDNVEVKWTKSPFHKAGTTSMLHKVQADKLVSKGMCELVKGGKTEETKTTPDGQNV